MNSYITLNGKRYKTSAKNWFPVESVPATVRLTLNGQVDVAYGPGNITEWQGTIEIEASPPTDYGSLDNFLTAARSRAELTFQDHYAAATYGVHLLAPQGYRLRALVPKWNAASNKFFVDVRIVKARTIA